MQTAFPLLENGANDEELFTLDTSRVGLFEVGINEMDIPEIAAAYGNVTLEEVEASMILVPGDWWVMGELQGELPPETEVEAILIL